MRCFNEPNIKSLTDNLNAQFVFFKLKFKCIFNFFCAEAILAAALKVEQVVYQLEHLWFDPWLFQSQCGSYC